MDKDASLISKALISIKRNYIMLIKKDDEHQITLIHLPALLSIDGHY